jgi:predicted DNA-binding protein with PD1-like motif
MSKIEDLYKKLSDIKEKRAVNKNVEWAIALVQTLKSLEEKERKRVTYPFPEPAEALSAPGEVAEEKEKEKDDEKKKQEYPLADWETL